MERVDALINEANAATTLSGRVFKIGFKNWLKY